jgi:hypothetical protein
MHVLRTLYLLKMADYLHESIPDVTKGHSSSKLNRNLSGISPERASKSYFTFQNADSLNNKKQL